MAGCETSVKAGAPVEGNSGIVLGGVKFVPGSGGDDAGAPKAGESAGNRSPDMAKFESRATLSFCGAAIGLSSRRGATGTIVVSGRNCPPGFGAGPVTGRDWGRSGVVFEPTGSRPGNMLSPALPSVRMESEPPEFGAAGRAVGAVPGGDCGSSASGGGVSWGAVSVELDERSAGEGRKRLSGLDVPGAGEGFRGGDEIGGSGMAENPESVGADCCRGPVCRPASCSVSEADSERGSGVLMTCHAPQETPSNITTTNRFLTEFMPVLHDGGEARFQFTGIGRGC